VPRPRKHIITVRTSNLKINIINYSYWLILYFLYSNLFYCSYTLIMYFLHFISYSTGFVSTRMLTCFLLSNVSFILSEQTQVNLLNISKNVMLLSPVSCRGASSLSTQMPACLFMLPVIPPWPVFTSFTHHVTWVTYMVCRNGQFKALQTQ
jgi:hypothetical protein